MRVHLEEIVERSTENEESPTAVGDCGPTEQEIDICKHPDEFPESSRLDKDSNSASKEVGKAVSYADIFLQTVSRNFTVDKDDKMHPETSVQAVSSDKGTVHVFSLKTNSVNEGIDNLDINSNPKLAVASPVSPLSFIKGVLPKYFNSEWSVAQFRLNEGSQYIVAFGHQKNTVVILGLDGSFYRCKFDPATNGEMTQLEYHNFLKPEEAF
ncbi:hypothetical protein POM88_047391 [Heracleum sosnowskyi]|uniref:Uncharacterized protein n=1 Tax=Heracleum sosnowskyi TaxID=360622 RepID=A0AAD8LXI8_9APIA|nr:hypothetical protein POM88_047391 [Heracleum sosnowskyi]